MAELSRCRSCDKPIRWAETMKGNAMPMDPDPVEDGNFAFLEDGRRVQYVGESALFIPERYKSHFATCRYARQNRKGAARAAADRARDRVLKGVS